MTVQHGNLRHYPKAKLLNGVVMKEVGIRFHKLIYCLKVVTRLKRKGDSLEQAIYEKASKEEKRHRNF